MKKIIAAVSTLFIAVALSLVAVAAPASAHTATLTGSVVCNTSDGSANVTWKVVNDYNELLNITASNNAAIPVGTTIAATGGGADTSKTFTQILPAPSNGHSATATLSFLWSGDNYTQNNTKFTTDKVSGCDVPPSKDASAAINDTAATCTSAETVSEGAVTNATWTYSHVTSTSYSFIATAKSGHEFSNGQTTETFSGGISPKLGGSTCDNTSTKAPLCEASGSNSYKSASLSYATILAGVNSGDIIPPFSYVKNGVSGSYPGQNWDTAHQAIYNNGCQSPPPCVPDSSVTYTYDSSPSDTANNSGVITVPDPVGSSGVLCSPFYVTAASWTYVDQGSTWPQTIHASNHVNGPVTTGPNGPQNAPIQEHGTYTFGAPVTCGQGDIYASFTAYDATLFPENDNLPGVGILTGSHTPLPEHFLSDMGFHGPTTYMNTSTSCWAGIPESGVATTTTLSCAAPSATNTLTLSSTVPGQPVPGGLWTVTGPDGYHKTYDGTFVGLATPSLLKAGTYTITLTDASNTDAYSVASYSTTWTVTNLTVPDCNTTVTPGTPTAVSITECGVDGSITIPDTTGVVYKLDGKIVPAGTISPLSGSHTVTATPAHGYEFKHNAKTVWTFDLHSESTCAATIQLGTCTADGNVSSVPVSLVLDNTQSSGSAGFLVKIDGVTYHTYTVAGHKSVTQSIGTAPTSGETIDVYINGSTTPIELTVDSFDGCVITNVPADPSHTDVSCNGGTTVLGSITVDGNPELTYTLHLPDGSTEVFPAGQPSTISGLAAGDYSVSVVANSGYVLGGSGSFPATVTILDAVDCSGTAQTPVVTAVTPTCDQNSPGTEVQGTITIESNPNMTFTIDDGTGATAIASGTHVEPDGSYTVVATLTSTAIGNGFTIATGAGYTVSGSGTVATFDPITFTATCDLTTLAVLPWSVSQGGTLCTVNGARGTITVTNDPEQLGTVKYTITNTATNTVVDTTTGTETFSLAPGSYNVRAIPSDTVDFGLTPNNGATAFVDTAITIAAATAACDGNLAFTGGTIGWFGFVLAGGMLFLGIAFLYMKRRGNRAAE